MNIFELNKKLCKYLVIFNVLSNTIFNYYCLPFFKQNVYSRRYIKEPFEPFTN